ncbi:2-succinylbenzoate-CoA ligase [Aphanothece hegewaldii CCALA 016]|uniref:2-succinylbenzoate-CoA ligase n=1 Tax=Aphanothece hegewaldii CCALA 016 TaxID=2107694 RepID=A0A2T1LWV3_9CHRO|nr:2-succinylbenzoate--CoA ligase [Aphanothece hegewaldii]PSF36637.1 2-succinylbenzoate-CoA ligase [Aphanothece hegewaldii CCALA 016]
MKDILETLKQRSDTNWLVKCNSLDFYRDTLRFCHQFKLDEQPTIFIAESNDYLFLTAFVAAIASESSIFLGNPDWKEQEWKQVYQLVSPDIVVGLCPSSLPKNIAAKSNLLNKIMIPTGGTSGQIKLAIHTWETLEASVRGFQEYFDVEKINSYCILPLYHVSGLMQFLRSWHTNGNFFLGSYNQLKGGILPEINPEEYFISLVPTQLQFLLNQYPEWLRKFRTVLLGGAPAWTSLLEQAKQEQINLALTYGMTETASQVVTLKPQEFLKGNISNGQVLPHANLKFNDEGIIIIEARSLYLGYYPNLDYPQELVTDDLGYFDEQNNLFILGRNSQKIITGGENVFPKEIENAILFTQLVKDVIVIGISDLKWGQIIIALYVPTIEDLTEDLIKQELTHLLSKYKHPKHWIKVDEIPRNIQGKINQEQLKAIVTHFLAEKG